MPKQCLHGAILVFVVVIVVVAVVAVVEVAVMLEVPVVLVSVVLELSEVLLMVVLLVIVVDVAELLEVSVVLAPLLRRWQHQLARHTARAQTSFGPLTMKMSFTTSNYLLNFLWISILKIHWSALSRLVGPTPRAKPASQNECEPPRWAGQRCRPGRRDRR